MSRRIVLLAALPAVPPLLVAAFWAAGHPLLPGWDSLAANHRAVLAWTEAHRLAAALLYVAVYAGVVGASLPAGGLLTVTGGWLFGAAAGTALAVCGASAGAILLFLLARSTLGRLFAARAAPWLDRVRPALQRDGFWGLLALRLFPAVPFWLGNLAPALLGMRLRPFAAATVLGIIPATAVFAGLGAGLGEALAAGQAMPLSLLARPAVLLPLAGLAVLSLAPIAVRRLVRGDAAP